MHRAGLGSWGWAARAIISMSTCRPGGPRSHTLPPPRHTPVSRSLRQWLKSLLVSGSEHSAPHPAAGDTPQAGPSFLHPGPQAEPLGTEPEPNVSLGLNPALLPPLAVGAHPHPSTSLRPHSDLGCA